MTPTMTSPLFPADPLTAALDQLWPVQQYAQFHTNTHTLTLSAPDLRLALDGQPVTGGVSPRLTPGASQATIVSQRLPATAIPLTARLGTHFIQFWPTSEPGDTSQPPTQSFGELPIGIVNGLLRDLDGLRQQECRTFLQGWTVRLNDLPNQAGALLSTFRQAQFPEAVKSVIAAISAGQPFLQTVCLGPELLMIGGTRGYLSATTSADHHPLTGPSNELRRLFSLP
jgi:hypothetical protein